MTQSLDSGISMLDVVKELGTDVEKFNNFLLKVGVLNFKRSNLGSLDIGASGEIPGEDGKKLRFSLEYEVIE